MRKNGRRNENSNVMSNDRLTNYSEREEIDENFTKFTALFSILKNRISR